jgi:flagellar biosynthesis chaperone FliJ
MKKDQLIDQNPEEDDNNEDMEEEEDEWMNEWIKLKIYIFIKMKKKRKGILIKQKNFLVNNKIIKYNIYINKKIK